MILPTYSRWVEADQALASSAWPTARGKEDLAKARDAFHAAQKAWAELQPLLIGPLAEGNRAWQVQFWPDKKDLVGRQVEQLLKNNPQVDAAALAKASVVVQGLSAYEYILFDSKIDLADAATKARYCPLLEAIGTHQQQLAQDILARWKNDGGMLTQMSKFPNDRYADAHEAIAELLRVQVTALDMLKKKLGTPLGRQSKGIPQPYQAEAWRSNALAGQPGRQPERRPGALGRYRRQGPEDPAAGRTEGPGRQDRRRLRRQPREAGGAGTETALRTARQRRRAQPAQRPL